MRLMQDEQPIEHHFTWRNSAFHRHDHGTVDKRKMLGGVSFDGGAALGNNKSRSSTTQAGVQEAQPPLTDKYNENLSLSELGIGLGRTKGTADTASQKESDGKAVKNTTAVKNVAADIKDEAAINENAAVHNIVLAADSFLDKIVTHITESNNLKVGRSSLLSELTLKLGKGIHTLLTRSGQDGNRQSEHRPKKKLSSGTRPVTKEEVYEVQINSSYLLESYNKNGERSTLGK
ncbi:MAG: hypothetical protein HDR03_02235 [Lachnospiraceae bacterium]|nr:hypothetical protein [Lachnospiraceae bacterium]